MSKDWNGLPDRTATTTRAGDEREAIAPLTEPVSIDKALLGGKIARVESSQSLGQPAVHAVFLVNIQVTGWSSDRARAEGFAEGFNRAAKWMQSAMSDRAELSAITEEAEWLISDDHARTLWSLARMISSTDWIKELRKSICGENPVVGAKTALEPVITQCWSTTDGTRCDNCGRGLSGHIDQRWCDPAALATAPEQVGEPFAYWWNDLGEGGKTKKAIGFVPPPYIPTSALNALYTAPPPASTNRLTDEQILAVMRDVGSCRENDELDHIGFARAIIAATEGKYE